MNCASLVLVARAVAALGVGTSAKGDALINFLREVSDIG